MKLRHSGEAMISPQGLHRFSFNTGKLSFSLKTQREEEIDGEKATKGLVN